jgi:hypothetical protein
VLEEVRTRAEEYRQLDDGRVLVLVHDSGRAASSGIDLESFGRSAAMFRIQHGRVMSLTVYFDRAHALEDLGLEE